MTPTPRRLRHDRKGNVAMIVALAATPIIGCVGLAVDAGAALRRQERLQAAVDSGVLAGLKAMPYADDAGVTAAADRYIKTNFSGLPYTLTNVVIDRTNARVDITASSPSKTFFGGIFGITQMDVSANAVAAGGGTIELVMALDNSGSMGDAGRMPALKDAAGNLVDALMNDSMIAGRIKIGVVPFSTAVNVGPNNATASWMDRNGANPFHGENFTVYNASQHNRFAMFTKMGQSWGGCVEARTTAGNLDVSDAAPSGDAKTLFVPMFAPDEPDTTYQGYSIYRNTYLQDHRGTCGIEANSGTETQKQHRVCKYFNQAPRTTHYQYGDPVGPNQKCESIPILPLTDNKSLVTGKLNAMTPRGNTNIVEGATWGWRVLTSAAPFSEGVGANVTGNRKIMIVMTDGENTMGGTSYWTGLSAYSAYGFASKARVRNPATSDETTLRNAMNDRLRLACSNAKSAKVEIFSIIVSAPSAAARDVMEDCASPNDETQHSFAVSSASELGDVFDQIARSVKEIRIAQ